MEYSVILSFDLPPLLDGKKRPIPKCLRFYRPWYKTEDDEQGDDYGVNWRHRKWCAWLTQAQFDKVVSDFGMSAEHCETMGSLGAPGFGIGIVPAISFNNEMLYSDDPIMNMYVTPVPVRVSKETLTERDWQRIRRAILHIYG